MGFKINFSMVSFLIYLKIWQNTIQSDDEEEEEAKSSVTTNDQESNDVSTRFSIFFLYIFIVFTSLNNFISWNLNLINYNSSSEK